MDMFDNLNTKVAENNSRLLGVEVEDDGLLR